MCLLPQVEAELIKLYLLQRDGTSLVCEDKSQIRIPLGEGIVGHVALSGRPLCVSGISRVVCTVIFFFHFIPLSPSCAVLMTDPKNFWRYDPKFDPEPAFPTNSVLVVPVTDHLGRCSRPFFEFECPFPVCRFLPTHLWVGADVAQVRRWQ